MKPLSLSLLLTLFITTSTLAGDGFRVDTAVYQAGVSKPIGRSTTYFTREVICDVSEAADPGEASALLIDRPTDTATIIGHPPVKGRSQITAASQVACRISYDEMLRTVAALSTKIKRLPLHVQFAAAPEFAVNWSEKGNRLSMTSEPMRYAVETKLATGREMQVASDYREFADWSARAAATRRFGMPPNARLELNDELAKKGHVPTQVKRTLKTAAGETTLVSTHEFQWQLSDADLERLEFWRTRAAELAIVDLVTLRHGPRVAGQKTATAKLK